MNSKILVAAGTALTVGMMTIAVPVFAQNDNAATNGGAQNAAQTGQFTKFKQNMRQNMQQRTPLTFEEQQQKMTEHLTTAQAQSQKMLDALKSGELETRLNERQQNTATYLQKIAAATTEEQLQAVREEMRTQIEALRESGELPLLGAGMGIGAPGKGHGMGRGMHKFAPPQTTEAEE